MDHVEIARNDPRARRKRAPRKEFCVLTKVAMVSGGGSASASDARSTGGGGETTTTTEHDGVDRMLDLVMDALEHYAAQRVHHGGGGDKTTTTTTMMLNPDALRPPSLSSKEVARVEQALGETRQAKRMFCNVMRFTLIQAQYRLYKAKEDYEALRNDFRPELLTLEQLALDMLRHEWHFREVVQLCEYLRRKRLAYSVYRRAIVVFDGVDAPLHSKTAWWERVFAAERSGYYYGVVVNLGLTALTGCDVSPPSPSRETNEI